MLKYFCLFLFSTSLFVNAQQPATSSQIIEDALAKKTAAN